MAPTTSTAARQPVAGDDSNDAGDGRTAVQKLREQADAVVQRIQPQLAAVSTYVREEPTKALLISAATGAALMGLVALIIRSNRGSRTASAGRSAMAAIRDAALDLADSAQTMALDALDATRKRAADLFEATQQRAAGALDATQQRASGALDATQGRAASAFDATQKRASDALDSTRKRAAAALDTAQERAAAAADTVSESVADAWKKVRDQAAPVVDRIKPQLDAATAYAKEDPVRAALGLAAAGAIVAGLIALARRAQDDE